VLPAHNVAECYISTSEEVPMHSFAYKFSVNAPSVSFG
jgi:hypothetical protein